MAHPHQDMYGNIPDDRAWYKIAVPTYATGAPICMTQEARIVPTPELMPQTASVQPHAPCPLGT